MRHAWRASLQAHCSRGAACLPFYQKPPWPTWFSRPAPCTSLQPGAQHGLAMVPEEVWRSRFLKCKQCNQSGAAMGCEVKSCPQTYHLPCAMLQASAAGGRQLGGLACLGMIEEGACC